MAHTYNASAGEEGPGAHWPAGLVYCTAQAPVRESVFCFVLFSKSEVGEMRKVGKELAYKLQELSLNTQGPRKAVCVVVHVCNPCAPGLTRL